MSTSDAARVFDLSMWGQVGILALDVHWLSEKKMRNKLGEKSAGSDTE